MHYITNKVLELLSLSYDQNYIIYIYIYSDNKNKSLVTTEDRIYYHLLLYTFSDNLSY